MDEIAGVMSPALKQRRMCSEGEPVRIGKLAKTKTELDKGVEGSVDRSASRRGDSQTHNSLETSTLNTTEKTRAVSKDAALLHSENTLSKKANVRCRTDNRKEEQTSEPLFKTGSGAAMKEYDFSSRRSLKERTDVTEFPWMEAFGGDPMLAAKYSSDLGRSVGDDHQDLSDADDDCDESAKMKNIGVRRFYSLPEAELRLATRAGLQLDRLSEKSSVNHDEIELRLQEEGDEAGFFDQPVKYRMRVNSLDKEKANKMQAQKLTFEQLYQAACSRK